MGDNGWTEWRRGVPSRSRRGAVAALFAGAAASVVHGLGFANAQSGIQSAISRQRGNGKETGKGKITAKENGAWKHHGKGNPSLPTVTYSVLTNLLAVINGVYVVEADCPNGTLPIGGGFTPRDNVQVVGVVQSGPVAATNNSPGQWQFALDLKNDRAEAQLDVTAICLAATSAS